MLIWYHFDGISIIFTIFNYIMCESVHLSAGAAAARNIGPPRAGVMVGCEVPDAAVGRLVRALQL